MKDHVRRAVAYIVLRLNSDNGVASVHDHSASKAFRYDAEVAPTKTRITFVEPETGGKISGLGGAGIFTITDEASGKKVSLKLKPGNSPYAAPPSAGERVCKVAKAERSALT